MSKRTLAAALVLASLVAPLLLASPAFGEATPEEKAAADSLYSSAGALMSAGNFAAACPKLETSVRLDPAIGGFLRLGYCLEHVGRTASAFSAFHEAEAMAIRAGDKRAADAAARAKALEPTLSRLSITPPASPVPGLEVKRDGKLVDPGLWGVAAPVDPGEHTIEATAPGRKPWSAPAHVEAGPGAMTVTIPLLEMEPADAGADAGAAGPSGDGWGAQRTAAVVVGGVGVVGLIVGTIFGVETLNKTSSARAAHCSMSQPRQCDPTGIGLENDAKTTANVSDAAFALAGAAAVVSVVLGVTAPSSKAKGTAQKFQIGPTIASRTTGLLLRGEW